MTPLRQRMLEDMQVRNLALNTQTCYVQQVSLFARHFNKSPELLGPEDIRSYQVYLTNEKKLATGTILIAVSALRFLYNVSLKKDWTSHEPATVRGAMGTWSAHSDDVDQSFRSDADQSGAKRRRALSV